MNFLLIFKADYPYIQCDSFDIWSNEFLSNFYAKEMKLKNYRLNELLGVSSVEINSSNKVSNLDVYEILTSENYLKQVNYDSRNDTIIENLDIKSDNKIYAISDVANYQSPLKMFRGYRLIIFSLQLISSIYL